MPSGSPEAASADAVTVGYWLSSEEHGPRDLVAHAVAAEAAGFEHAVISDHVHPWVPQQGNAPYVWAVLGAIAQATDRLHLATGVTAPLLRNHPVTVAQAAATTAVLLEGRFALGVGTGERLNEHVTGDAWPRPAARRAHLAESIEVIRRLFAGDEVSFDGEHVTVQHAQLWSRPDVPPPIWVAASGPKSAALAGSCGDGLIGLQPDATLVGAYERAGGSGERVAQVDLCWAETEAEARATALRWWPNGGMPSGVHSELARPRDFEALADLVTEDRVAGTVLCGPDPDPVVRAVLRFAAAGFTRVHLHQVGPDQAGFFSFWERSLRPVLAPS